MSVQTPAAVSMPATSAAPAVSPKTTPNRRVFSAAVNSAEFFDHLRAHFRETRRTRVEIDCDIQLLFNDGTVFDSGSAIVRDFSPSGALVCNMKTTKCCYPTSPFKLQLTLKGGGYNGICIDATPVRFAMDSAGLGVRFDEIVVEV